MFLRFPCVVCISNIFLFVSSSILYLIMSKLVTHSHFYGQLGGGSNFVLSRIKILQTFLFRYLQPYVFISPGQIT